jgi:ketosteroid isomerase-like protein
VSVNLDLVRSILAGWERGDWSSYEWADPEVKFERLEGPEPGSWTGLAAGGAFRNFLSAWDDLRMQADEYRELDDERVLVLGRLIGHGRTSGLELGQMRTNGACLFHMRGDKVTRLVLYWNRDRALADLGLKE